MAAASNRGLFMALGFPGVIVDADKTYVVAATRVVDNAAIAD